MSWESSQIGRFRIERVLGRGGMGVVLRAFDPQLERAVAIKVLSERAVPVAEGTTLDLRAGGPQRDLLAEARALAQITDPNVLAVHEIGTEAGRTFLVMELVEGMDLRSWLSVGNRTLGEIRPVFEQAARGLAAAHRRDIVHRDFKPENVLISPDGRVRVADFGIAALGRSTGLVRLGTAGAGTPRYMAPELWQDAPATVKSDIFAFATTLVEAIVGEPPSDRDAVATTLVRHHVDEQLRRAIVRSLDPDPAQRPDTIDELIEALRGQPRKRRWWLVATGVTAAAGVAASTIVMMREPAHDAIRCEDAQVLVARRWGDVQRVGVRVGIAGVGAAEEVATKAIATLDTFATEWSRMYRETCAATDLPVDRKATRLACLERRLLELGAVSRALSHPVNREMALGRSRSLPDLDVCAKVLRATIPDRPEAKLVIEDMIVEIIQMQDKAIAEQSEGNQARLDELEANAMRIGEIDLVVRIRNLRGQLLGNRGKIAAAIKSYDAAYQIAAKHGLDTAAARALVDSARQTLATGDLGGAERSLAIAQRLLDGAPDATPNSHVRLLRAVADVRTRRGNPAGALEALERAAVEVERIKPRDPLSIGRVANDRAIALTQLGKFTEALELAKQAEALLRPLGSSATPDLGSVLASLANIQRWLGDEELSTKTVKERLDMFERYYPPGTAPLVVARADYGGYLDDAGKHREAIATFEKALAEIGDRPDLRQYRHLYMARIGRSYRSLDDFDRARAWLERAADEARAQFGERDKHRAPHLIELAHIDMDTGKFARAEARLVAAETVLADVDVEHPDRLFLAGSQVMFLCAQHKYAAGAELAAKHIAALDERNVEDARKDQLWLVRSWALWGVGRYTEGLAIAEKALASRKARKTSESSIMLAEFEVARNRYGLGDRAAAEIVRKFARTLGPESRAMRKQLAEWSRRTKERVVFGGKTAHKPIGR